MNIFQENKVLLSPIFQETLVFIFNILQYFQEN